MADIPEKKDAKINVELSTNDLKVIIEILDFAIEELELGAKEIEDMKEKAKDNELLLLDNEKWRQLNSRYGKHLQQIDSIETLHHYLSYTLKLHDIPSNATEDT
jgi:hypothetical protein